MPESRLGQQITFAIEYDEDRELDKWVTINVHPGDTILSIAGRRGHPELARRIARRNNIRSVTKTLRHPNPSKKQKKKDVNKITVPKALKSNFSFSVLADEQPPRITSGYAKFSTIDRPERRGLTIFDGYDPLTMVVPIRFEEYRRAMAGLADTVYPQDSIDVGGHQIGTNSSAAGRLRNPQIDVSRDFGQSVEDDIELLERMAGRGTFQGAASGPPPVLHVSSTDDQGNMVGLIPRSYQWTRTTQSGIKWRIAGIEWDESPLRDAFGRRIRQSAVVTLQEHTQIHLATRREIVSTKKGKDHDR
jgi:hypothetical protein